VKKEDLNPYSQKVYELVTCYYPDWARLADETHYEKGAFQITIPSPQGTRLGIYTYNQEITVSFSNYHTHFGCWAGCAPEDAFNYARSFIDDLQNERIFVINVFENRQWIYSETLTVSKLEQMKAKFRTSTRKLEIIGWNSIIQ
jgi:hypothetical protein